MPCGNKKSYVSSNRKNHNAMLAKHVCLSENQTEQDHNGTRIVSAHKLIRSVLRVKRGVKEHFREFKVRDFLTGDEWKTVREFEETLR